MVVSGSSITDMRTTAVEFQRQQAPGLGLVYPSNLAGLTVLKRSGDAANFRNNLNTSLATLPESIDR